MTSAPALLAVPTSDLSFHLTLPVSPRACALARRTITGVLSSWNLTDEDWIYDVLLLSTELVGNAVRHGGRRLELDLRMDGTCLRIDVSDGSSLLPAPREDPDESGRGLAIIEALAREWGVVEDGDGKSVWATMVLPPAAPSGSAARAGQQ